MGIRGAHFWGAYIHLTLVYRKQRIIILRAGETRRERDAPCIILFSYNYCERSEPLVTSMAPDVPMLKTIEKGHIWHVFAHSKIWAIEQTRA